MLLLGLIGIVGLALLAYNFKLTLVFLTVLVASLLTSVPLRKFLLGLQRGRQESSVVTTFWGSTTLFLASLLSLIAFFYFEEELPRITALDPLVFIISWTAILSTLVGLFILVFLRSKTGFPWWTVVLAAFSWLTVLTVPFLFLTRIGEQEPQMTPLPLLEVFDVSYHAKAVFREKVLEVEEEYKILPNSRYLYLPVSIDDKWLNRTPGVSLKHLHLARESAGTLTGLSVTIRREIEAEITNLGLLRRKLELFDWDLPVRINAVSIKNLTETPPTEEADGEHRISTFSLQSSLIGSAKLEVRLPKNSYLGSYPEGKLVKLPDRDQFVLDFSDQHPNLELYYLAGLRFGLVQSILGDSSAPDIALKTIAFLFWPVVLLVLGATQRSLGDLLVKAIQRKPQRRRAGF
jgi:hypothetical protein